MRRNLTWFSASLGLHAVLLIVFVLSERRSKPRIHHVIEVETFPGGGGTLSGNSGKGHTRTSARKKVTLRELGIRNIFPQGASNAGTGDVQRKDGRLGDPKTDWVKEGRVSNLMRVIYERIDSNLAYPTELKRAMIDGTVTARIRFLSDGSLTPERTEIDSSSRYLKVLVWRTLRRALAEPIPNASRFFTESFAIEAIFEFEITEHHDEDLIRARKGFLANRMSFYRLYHHSKIHWDLGPLSGEGPFFPTFGLDFLWFPRKIGESLSNKAKIDPLDRYRDDPMW